MKVSLDLLTQYEKEGKITIREHPELPYLICNYTEKCTFGRMWDEITLMCRGLIIDKEGNVLARPFKKFFNIEEYRQENFFPPPKGNFKTYDKLDGSLGILYHVPEGLPCIATRGSFTSAQAIEGTKTLQEHLEKHDVNFDKDLTYLFEIIYPENRIVLDYGMDRKLVLLAVLDIESGKDLDLDIFESLGFEIAKRYEGVVDPNLVRSTIPENNKEGVVLLYDSGERVKIKFEKYIRLHRLVAGINKLRIWDMLLMGDDIEEYAAMCPDEFSKEVLSLRDTLLSEYKEIEDTIKGEFRTDFQTRKEAALYFKTCKYPMLMFRMLDNKSYEGLIWMLIKPKGL